MRSSPAPWTRTAAALAALILATAAPAAAPAIAQDIDPANPPPWPAGRFPQGDPPSRFDRAPPQDLAAAARRPGMEASDVLSRRIFARDPALVAWAQAGAASGDPMALTVLARIRSGGAYGFGGDVSDSDRAETLRLLRQAAALATPRRCAGSAVTTPPAGACRRTGSKLSAGGNARRRRATEWPCSPSPTITAPRPKASPGARWLALSEPTPPPRQMPWLTDVEGLTAAAQAGDVAAMRELGFVYDGALGRERQPERSFHWRRMAAERGDPYAMAHLGQMYVEGKGVRRDVATGLEWLHKSAGAGVRVAMYYLSQTYKTGDGVQADPELARTWIQRSFWAPDLPITEPQLTPPP